MEHALHVILSSDGPKHVLIPNLLFSEFCRIMEKIGIILKEWILKQFLDKDKDQKERKRCRVNLRPHRMELSPSFQPSN
ncbi:hypothetical protein BpHYR1_049965 [Brachionus plicatilis]|uniref:Uncharacterized protein n=1 Tax=Brachionus plicatilis TaxID=10195 RepID=A0A3M7R5B0_BRAPC|nr:hypothetical protein BpHYR1_049965 [Brachionus plicatilis]